MSQPPPRDRTHRKKKTTAPIHPAHEAGGTGTATGAPPVEPEAPKEAPQAPPAAPNATGEGEGTGDASGGQQGGAEGDPHGRQVPAVPPVAPEAGAVDARATAPELPADGTIIDSGPSQLEVSRGPRLPDMGQILARRGSTTMNPQLHALLTRGIEVEFMKVTQAFRQMMQRSDDLTAQVNLARDQGYPESDIMKLAIKHEWEVPPTSEELRQ